MKKVVEKATLRLVRNRWGYTPEELEKARRTGLVDAIGIGDLAYWIKAEPVCSRHCMGENYEGKPLYFDAMGGLIRRKCPPEHLRARALPALSAHLLLLRSHAAWRGSQPHGVPYRGLHGSGP